MWTRKVTMSDNNSKGGSTCAMPLLTLQIRGSREGGTQRPAYGDASRGIAQESRLRRGRRIDRTLLPIQHSSLGSLGPIQSELILNRVIKELLEQFGRIEDTPLNICAR